MSREVTPSGSDSSEVDSVPGLPAWTPEYQDPRCRDYIQISPKRFLVEGRPDIDPSDASSFEVGITCNLYPSLLSAYGGFLLIWRPFTHELRSLATSAALLLL